MDKEQAVGQSMRMVCFGGSRENLTGGKELGFGCLILLESLQSAEKGCKNRFGAWLDEESVGTPKKAPRSGFIKKNLESLSFYGRG